MQKNTAEVLDLAEFLDFKEQEAAGNKVVKLKEFQFDFLFSKKRHPAMVSSWATGKSLCGIARAMRLSENYPNNLGVIFRKEYTDLRDSTSKDFTAYTGLKISSEREVILPNGSCIMFRHLEEVNPNIVQNMNLGWFWIEQAEELDDDTLFFLLWGRLRRENVPHSGFITANTKGHNWIYKLWKSGQLENSELVEANTYQMKDVLAPDFMESLEVLKKRSPRTYNRFVMNSWEDDDSSDLIIQPHWVKAARDRDVNVTPPIRKIVSVDVARYGDDRTVLYALEGGKTDECRVIGKEVWEKKSTMETVGLALQFAKRNGGIDAFAIDEIGVGGGVVDRLQELDKKVVPVNSSKKSGILDRFYNVRAEFYNHGADLFEMGKIELLPDDEDLMEELSWAKYKTIKSNGIYQVEGKEDIKKRYQKSPDLADCFLMGLWALKQVEPVTKKDKYARAAETGVLEFNPMTV